MGIDIRDTLPAGFIISDIEYNPYEGIISSGIGTGVFGLEQLTLLPGIDSIILRVTVGTVPNGIYKNQAELTGLPASLGESVRSDDPSTLVKRDSTALIVRGYTTGMVYLSERLCSGDDMTLDAQPFGNTFLWDNGSTDPGFVITTDGQYRVTATTDCDTVVVVYTVEESRINAYFNPDQYEVRFGDTITLTPIVTNNGDTTFYRWLAAEGDALPCVDCPQIMVIPVRDTEYTLLVMNESGCTSSATVRVVVDLTRRVFAPNVFSPNDDKVNDEFYLRINGIASINRFAVFDRSGNTVFTAFTPMSAQPEVRWSGEHGGQPMAPGVYVWIAEVKFADGSEEIATGDVTLLR
jgi:gliding motility-associated-like protein